MRHVGVESRRAARDYLDDFVFRYADIILNIGVVIGIYFTAIF